MSENSEHEVDPAGPEDRSDAAQAQLPPEDTLLRHGEPDPLDEGWSPPDFPRAGLYDETPLDEELGETIDRELHEEEPETWEDDAQGTQDEEDAYDVRHDLYPDGADPRAGRLAADPDALDGRGNDVFADDEGISGGGASAEEAAVHVVADREQEYSEEILDDITDTADDQP